MRASFSQGLIAAATPPSYTSNFPLTQNPLSEGGIWIPGASSPPRTNVQSDGSHAFGTMFSFNGTDFNDSISVVNIAWPADQWVLGQLWNTGAVSGQEAELVLWGTIQPTNNTGLELDGVLATGHLDLVSWDGPPNAFTNRASATGITYTHGDYIFGQIKSGVVTVKKGTSSNTTPIAIIGDLSTILTHNTAGDSLSFSGGSPGQGHWNQTGNAGASTNLGWQKWWAGTFDSSGNLVF